MGSTGCAGRVMLAAMCVHALSNVSFAYEIAKGHPRIFLRARDLPELARKCGAGGPFREEYAVMKKGIDAVLGANGNVTLGHWLPELPLVYLVERALGHEAKRYADYVRTRMWGTDGRGAGTGRTGDGRASYGLVWTGGVWFGWSALTYDWMYDAFTPEERRIYAEVLGPWLCNRGWTRGPSKSPEIRLDPGIDNYWYNQTWGTCDGYAFGNYYMRQGVGPKALVALAIYGEGTRYDAHARAFLDSFDAQMRRGFLPALNARGGVPTEGPYHGSGMVVVPALALEAYRTAAGEDLFTLLGRHGMLAETPLWFAYTTMPHNGAMGYIDDASPGMNRGVGGVGRVMPLIARRFGQPVAQHYALGHYGHMPRTNGPLSWYRRDGWCHILWLDRDAPATAPSRLPLAYHFPGTGHVYMRSRWQDPDATWAFFGAGDRIVGCWGSDDEGSFQIFKGGPLAPIQSRGPSVLHNTVLVYDPDEPTGNRPNAGGHRNWYLEKGAGTRPLAAGRIIAYEDRPEYTYACADLTRAYYPGKMRAYRRHFLYLRADPECFIVYDRVQATGAELPTTWLMYAMNEPRVRKGGLAAEPTSRVDGSHRAFEGNADSVYVSTYTPEHNPKRNGSARGRASFGSSGFGTMSVRVLLPEKVRLTTRCSGFSRNPHAPATRPKSGPLAEAGTKRRSPPEKAPLVRWRIEEEPLEQHELTEFLNVLVPRLVAEAEAEKAVTGEGLDFPEARLIGRDAGQLGLRVSSARGDWEVVLPRADAAAGLVRHSPAGGGAAVSVQLATEVRENGEIPGYAWNPLAESR